MATFTKNKTYAWLNTLGTLPKMLTEALALYGTKELSGAADNPTILAWAKECGLKTIYTADSVPWCGLFIELIARRAGKDGRPKHPLWALNWKLFGRPAAQPCLGFVLVFMRPEGGHVGLYVAEDKTHYHVLGGNQSNAVNIVRIPKTRLVAVREPPFRSAWPASVRPYVIGPDGVVTDGNER